MLRYRDIVDEEYRAYRMKNGEQVIYDEMAMTISEEYLALLRNNEFINRGMVIRNGAM